MPTVHAENGELVYQLQQELLRRWASPAPRATRCRARRMVEGEAANRAIAHRRRARHAALHRARLAASSRSRPSPAPARSGQRVYGEVLAGHLRDRRQRVPQPGLRAPPPAYVMSPPFRPKEHQEALWRGLQSGKLHTTATDHCCFCADAEGGGQGRLHARSPTAAAASRTAWRCSGTRGVNTGPPDARASSSRVTSTNAAQIFNIYPRKGCDRRRRRRRPRGLGPERHAAPSRRRPSIRRSTSTSSRAARCAACPSHTVSQGKLVYANGDLRAEAGRRAATSSARRSAPTSQAARTSARRTWRRPPWPACDCRRASA